MFDSTSMLCRWFRWCVKRECVKFKYFEIIMSHFFTLCVVRVHLLLYKVFFILCQPNECASNAIVYFFDFLLIIFLNDNTEYRCCILFLNFKMRRIDSSLRSHLMTKTVSGVGKFRSDQCNNLHEYLHIPNGIAYFQRTHKTATTPFRINIKCFIRLYW